MNVLSVFDGMSCGQIALQRVGIPVDKYFASEIDKYAIQITMKNHPDTIQLGDINGWKSWDLPKIDLLIGGSPCQGFSFAGKGLNFDDPRSKLFFVYVDILKHLREQNPDLKFLLENVRMKKEHQAVITEYLGVEPIMIDSALVSAQSRKRLYWTNIHGVTLPEDKGILLRNVIESGMVDRNKSYCIDHNYWKGGNVKNYKEKARRQIVGLPSKTYQSEKRLMVKEDVGIVFNGGIESGRRLNDGKNFSRNYREGYRLYSANGKASSISAQPKGGPGGYTGLYDIEDDANRCVQVGEAKGIKGHGYNRRVYSQRGKAPTLNGNSRGNLEPKIALDLTHYRKLTPLECERLQTVPDGYTEGVSNTQRYKMLGNGWTVDVIAHIFSNLVNS